MVIRGFKFCSPLLKSRNPKMPHLESRCFRNNLPDYIKSVDLSIETSIHSLGKALAYVIKGYHRNPSIYTGEAGIAYMCWHVSRIPGTESAMSRQGLISTGLTHARHALAVQQKTSPETNYGWSLLSGEAGALVAAALCLQGSLNIQQELGETPRPEVQDELQGCIDRYVSLSPLAKTCKEDEFLYGRAGYLFGCLMLNHHISPQSVPSNVVLEVAGRMLESGRRTAEGSSGCGAPLYYYWHDSNYLGAAHGLMGIMYVLLHVWKDLEAAVPGSHKDIKDTIDFILTLECDSSGHSGVQQGYYPSRAAAGTGEREPLVHWCHGSPGAIYLFVKAHQVLGDERYLAAALRAGEVVWQKGLLKKGPGCCHGVSGNALALLYLWRATKDDKWLHRAIQFAHFLNSDEFHHHARTPDHPQSLFEGWAAAACLWADLLQPSTAGFPLFVLDM